MSDDRLQRIKKQRAYANALLLSAINIGGVDEALVVRSDLDAVVAASVSNSIIGKFFKKELDETDKERARRNDTGKIIRQIFKDANNSIIEILQIMADNNDLGLCMGMQATFDSLFEQYYKCCLVDVYTVVSLDDKLRSLIKKKVQNDFDTDVILHEHITKSLLGGIVLKAKNRVLDCSILSIAEKSKTLLTSVHNYG